MTPVRFGFAAAIAGSLMISSTAFAFGPRERPLDDGRLHLVSGEPLRLERKTSYDAPAGVAAYERLRTSLEGWHGMWDADTQVPARLYGKGVDAPGSIHSPEVAEAAARAFLVRWVDLVAPGAKASDFVVAANALDHGLRTVGMIQWKDGTRVEGAQLSFLFKKDRLFMVGSEAAPRVPALSSKTIGAEEARDRALAYVIREISADATVKSVSEPSVLPAVLASGDVRFAQVRRVLIETRAPIGRYSVFVDAITGAPYALRQELRFGNGTFTMNRPERWPGDGTRADHPAPHLTITVDNNRAETAVDGTFAIAAGATAHVTSGVSGPFVDVVPATGTLAHAAFDLADGATYAWSGATEEKLDAQLITFLSAHVVKDRVRVIAPNLRYLDQQLTANVNMDDVCNAFSDGDTVNFFNSGMGCENTGRIPDVIYHEFGHAVHAHSIIQGAGSFDTSLSEGVSDYLAATTTGDPQMGRGFFFDNRPLRDLDPAGSEARWPDDISQDPHETGLIIGGALWDLRKALVAKYGEAAAITMIDNIWYAILENAADIPSSYAAAIAANDDDGNLQNGTPDLCEINAAFVPHGLAEASQVGPQLGQVSLNGFDVTLPFNGTALCPGTELMSATMHWELRSNPSVSGDINMNQLPTQFEGLIPQQMAGEVVKYGIDVRLTNGSTLHLPDNPADPMYELFVGQVTPLYCTDFENDPTADGWTHRLVSGRNTQGADDWQWGTPNLTPGSGDPGNAHSGSNVIGNDLGGMGFNGLYQTNHANAMTSPKVAVMGHRNVRLQYYRWLNVEDGFFDHATIQSGSTVLWQNYATNANGDTHHKDKEWRFQDVDLSSAIDADGNVQVSFQLASDQGLTFGGWTVDDFCVVSFDTATQPVCGNGTQEMGEQCDDANTTSGDGCEADCTKTPPAICGDGHVSAGEACDDGNQVDTDACNNACQPTSARCGDGTVNPGEQCDDGNTNDGDGCSATCTTQALASCGNGHVDPGEDCDEGASNGSATCTALCKTPPGMLGTIQDKGCGCQSTDASPRSAILGLGMALIALGLMLRRDKKRA
ncbi:MAG: DUF4215 domain-containing protein [Myxococcota bacterium]